MQLVVVVIIIIIIVYIVKGRLQYHGGEHTGHVPVNNRSVGE